MAVTALQGMSTGDVLRGVLLGTLCFERFVLNVLCTLYIAPGDTAPIG
jgi:hypothetical protein